MRRAVATTSITLQRRAPELGAGGIEHMSLCSPGGSCPSLVSSSVKWRDKGLDNHGPVRLLRLYTWRALGPEPGTRREARDQRPPGNPWPSWTGCVALGILFLAHEMGTVVVSCGLTRVFISEMDRRPFADLLLSKHFRTTSCLLPPGMAQERGGVLLGDHPKPLLSTQASPQDHPPRLDPQSPSPPRPPQASRIPTWPLAPNTTDKPEVTQEQKKEFLDVIKCIDIQESEIIYTDEKKVSARRWVMPTH